MNLVYNSPNYCVVEFAPLESRNAGDFGGGYEIMDKTAQRETFIQGELADNFRKSLADLAASEPSVEEFDAYLSRFDAMMRQPLIYH